MTCSLIFAVPFPLSPPNSRLIESSVSERTSLTSATEEFTDFGSIICIFGENSFVNCVPSPKTRQGSLGDSHMWPAAGFAESAARATGTRRIYVHESTHIGYCKTHCYPWGERRNRPIFSPCFLQQSRTELVYASRGILRGIIIMDRETEEADFGPARKKVGNYASIPDYGEEHQQRLQDHLEEYGMLLVVEFPGRRSG